MWGRKEDTRWSEQACGSRYRYKEWGNMECFENLIIVFDSILYNIPYGIVETFSLIHGCTHGWSNHVKTYVWSFYLCVFELTLFAWQLPLSQQTSIRAWVEDFKNSKILQSTQDEYKRNFSWRWSRLFSHGDMIQKTCVMERLKMDFMEFGPRWRLLEIIPNS